MQSETRYQRQSFETSKEPVGEWLVAHEQEQRRTAGDDYYKGGPGVSVDEESCQTQHHQPKAIRQPFGDDYRRRAAEGRPVQLAQEVALQPLADLARCDDHTKSR